MMHMYAGIIGGHINPSIKQWHVSTEMVEQTMLKAETLSLSGTPDNTAHPLDKLVIYVSPQCFAELQQAMQGERCQNFLFGDNGELIDPSNILIMEMQENVDQS